MTPRRELTASILGCLAGAALLLVAGGRTWARVTRPLPFHGSIAVPGHDLTSVTTAVGVLALAAVAALVATRGRGRLLTGVVLAAAGVAAAVLCATAAGADAARTAAGLAGSGAVVSATGWQWAGVVGAAVVALAGILTAARGRRWPAMGSRYDAPQQQQRPARDPEAVLWEALDRGEDPTD